MSLQERLLDPFTARLYKSRLYYLSKLVGAGNFANPAKVRRDSITKTCFRPISICASDTQSN